MESKDAKFKRLATLRGNRILKDINLLGNLSNRNNYSYTDEEIRRLFAPLEEELKQTRALFVVKKQRINL